MNLDKQLKFLISIAYYGILIAGVYLFIRFLVPPLTPFLLGFAVAWLLRRPAMFLADKLHIPKKLRKVPSLLLTVAFYILVIGIFFFLGAQIGSVLGEFLPRLPDLVKNQILPLINRSVEIVREFLAQYDIAAAEQIDTWFRDLSSEIVAIITSFSTSAVKFISSIAAGMPSLILKIVLTVISTFYFSLDFDRITAFLRSLLPQKGQEMLHSLKEKAHKSLGVFIRSYILVFLMTCAELSLGFYILKIPYALLLGIVVAVVDILPVLGTGLVLLPWSLVCLIIGNYFLGIGILLLYIIITVIRNIVEPKLVGNQIGLHPLATLISMFVGLQLFGLLGLFLFPVTLSILVQFKDDMGRAYKHKLGMDEEDAETAAPNDSPKE
ncbi:MAG: sporulation integral membrane protein YtvI [Clostridia bacterium]|nr:sporulation integral membrane protein YtvI [Clostridia bacterium]